MDELDVLRDGIYVRAREIQQALDLENLLRQLLAPVRAFLMQKLHHESPEKKKMLSVIQAVASQSILDLSVISVALQQSYNRWWHAHHHHSSLCHCEMTQKCLLNYPKLI